MLTFSYSLQAEEDKANRLNKLKNKLEGQVQETHDELEKEKREKAEVEKVRRKLEGDLKTTQEQVDNITHAKEELERTLSGYVWYRALLVTGSWFLTQVVIHNRCISYSE